MLVYHPVFESQDSQHLRGFALAVLQMETLLRNTIDSQADSGVVMNLFELHANEPRQMLASTENSHTCTTAKSAVQFNRPLMAFGKTFLLSASPYKTFLKTHPNYMGLVITIAGLIITAAITILIKLIANRQKELERLVDERTSTLQASEERIQLILNSTAEAIYGLDINGNCTFCNNSCLRLLGYARPEDLLGKNMHAQIHGKYPDGTPFPMELCHILKAFQHGEEIHVEEDVFWRSNGTSFPVEYWSYPQRRGNSLIGAVVTFLDITERKQSKEKLEQHVALIDSLLDSIPDIIFFKSLNGTYSGCNPAFCEFVGKTRDSVIGRTDYGLFGQEIADSFRENDRVMLKLCQPRLNEEWITYPDGRKRLVDTLKTPHWGPDRKVMGILGISRDITKRKSAENALKELNDSLESEVEKRTAELYKANLVMRDEIMLRRKAENALRYRLFIEGAVSQASKTFLCADDVDINEILRILGNSVSAHRAYIFEFDNTLLKMDNTYEWCSPSVQPQKQNLQNIETCSLPWWMNKIINNETIVITDIEQMPPEAEAEQSLLKSQDIRSLLVVPMVWSSGKLAGFLGFDDTVQSRTWLEEDIAALKIVAEITILYWERKKATEESLVYESQLSALSSRLQQMLEDERKKISREIHDELGTILTVLKFDISSLAKAIPESSEGLHDKIHSISTTIDTTIKLVQDICTELRPDLIDNMGLTDEIEWYTSEFSHHTGIKCSLELPEAFELEPDRSIAVFRIFQELLTNVARHAKATSLNIEICIKNKILELTITDDGCGINPKQTASARSLGLIGIRERVKFLNGHFEIAGNPVRGTTAKLTIVLTGKNKDDKSNDL